MLMNSNCLLIEAGWTAERRTHPFGLNGKSAQSGPESP